MMEQIDNIEEDISEMKTDIKKNTEDVADHIRRTEILEKQVENRPCSNNEFADKIVSGYVNRKAILFSKIFVAIGAIAGAAIAIAKFFDYF